MTEGGAPWGVGAAEGWDLTHTLVDHDGVIADGVAFAGDDDGLLVEAALGELGAWCDVRWCWRGCDLQPSKLCCTHVLNCDCDCLRRWRWSRRAFILVVDVEDIKVEAEEDRIKIKVVVDWSEPGAGIVNILEAEVAFERWELSDRLALVWRTEVGIGRWVLFEVAAISGRSAELAWWATPEIVGRQWGWRCVGWIDNSGWAGNNSGEGNGRCRCPYADTD